MAATPLWPLTVRERRLRRQPTNDRPPWRKAAVARRLRAELKEKLKMGSISLSDLLRQADTDEVVGKMKVLSVWNRCPARGKKVKARRLMRNGISETRRLHGLATSTQEALRATQWLTRRINSGAETDPART